MSEQPPELRPIETAEPAERPRRRTGRAVVWVIALLVAVAMAAYGLLPLFSGGGDEEQYEPGPLPAEPAGSASSFGEQRPEWRPCADGVQCADVYAPIDWQDPAGERITLRLVKQPATGGEARGTLFVNPGGPGASGAEFVAAGVGGSMTAEVQAEYDVIGWDPRGVGGSAPVSCLDDEQMDRYLFGAGDTEDLEQGSEAWIEAALAESAEFGAACSENTGPLLAHVGTDDTVHDLDMLRAISGDEALNYIGYSYGTYIGARYADAFPDRVGRMVLDGAMDPAAGEFEVVREQTRGFEQALRAYAADCLSRDECPLTGSVDDAMAQIGELLDEVDARPIEADDGRTLHAGTMLTAIIAPLYAPESWPALDQLFETVAAGEADVAFHLADFYYDREDGGYADNKTEAFFAINCADYPNDLDVERMREQAAELEEIAPTIGRFQGYGDVACSEWPVDAAPERGPVTGAGAAPILVVGTTGDPATPYRWAESLASQLESAALVTYRGEGHTAYGSSDCVDSVVDAYLLEGAVPEADPMCS